MNLQEFHSNPEVTAAIEKAVEATLLQIGEDPQREGLKKTPHRVGNALQFLTKGYKEDPEAILRSALFEEDYRQMVVVKDIDFYSLCEHHMLPFFGKVHVAYIPNGRITGWWMCSPAVFRCKSGSQHRSRIVSRIPSIP